MEASKMVLYQGLICPYISKGTCAPAGQRTEIIHLANGMRREHDAIFVTDNGSAREGVQERK